MVDERIQRKLLTRQGLLARNLARRLIGNKVGDRVPGVADLAQDSGVGYGTVQEAMRLLDDVGAASFRRRGAQGTVLEEVNDEVLWELASAGALAGGLPLPYTRRYEGLATGLFTSLAGAGVPINLSFMRGGVPRLEALLAGGLDFAVTSVFTAEAFAEDNPDAIEVALRLGPGTYVSKHQTIFGDPRNERLEAGMRVGIDRDSVDQSRMTEMEIEEVDGEVELVPLTYTQLLRELEVGELDAAVWNSEDINGSRFKVVPLRSPKARDLSGSNTAAAVSVRADDDFTARILGTKLHAEQLLGVQQEVLDGTLVPRY